jgi:two-component system, NarL family, response regulator LiaR
MVQPSRARRYTPTHGEEGAVMAINVLIVDDHNVVRRGLRMFLEDDPELQIVGEARNGAEAVTQARTLKPDVILMDLVMPVMDGITAIGVIRGELPDTEVIALTSVLEDASVAGAVRAGAIGYLLKDTRSEELCRAIKTTLAGGGGAAVARGARARQRRGVDGARSRRTPAASGGQVQPADRVRPGDR